VQVDPQHGYGAILWIVALYPPSPEAGLAPNIDQYLEGVGAHRLGRDLWILVMFDSGVPVVVA